MTRRLLVRVVLPLGAAFYAGAAWACRTIDDLKGTG